LRQAGMRREPQVSILNDFSATTGTTELRCARQSRLIRFRTSRDGYAAGVGVGVDVE